MSPLVPEWYYYLNYFSYSRCKRVLVYKKKFNTINIKFHKGTLNEKRTLFFKI